MAKTESGAKACTPAEETFCQCIIRGYTQADAYREAIPSSKNWADTTLWPKASRMASRPRVAARLQQLRDASARAAVFTLADHLRNLETISLGALKAGDYNAAARAEEARGRASGFYIQKTEVTGKNGGPIETKQTRDLTPEELRAELERYGIKP